MQTVMFQAESAAELKQKIADYCKEFGVNVHLPAISSPAESISETAKESAEAKSEPQPEKKGRGRPPKAKSATSFIDEEEAVEEAAPAKVAVTKEAVTAKMQEIISQKGLPVAISILNKFGVAKISSLPADKYAECLAAADAALLQ